MGDISSGTLLHVYCILRWSDFWREKTGTMQGGPKFVFKCCSLNGPVLENHKKVQFHCTLLCLYVCIMYIYTVYISAKRVQYRKTVNCIVYNLKVGQKHSKYGVHLWYSNYRPFLTHDRFCSLPWDFLRYSWFEPGPLLQKSGELLMSYHISGKFRFHSKHAHLHTAQSIQLITI